MYSAEKWQFLGQEVKRDMPIHLHYIYTVPVLLVLKFVLHLQAKRGEYYWRYEFAPSPLPISAERNAVPIILAADYLHCTKTTGTTVRR